MSLTPQQFSILRERRTGDGAGGKTVVLYSLAKRYMGTLNRRRTTNSDLRLEQGAHNTQGPGVETATRRIVCFKPPFPIIHHDDRLVSSGGSTYTVHFIRPYEWTLQIDVEEVGS